MSASNILFKQNQLRVSLALLFTLVIATFGDE